MNVKTFAKRLPMVMATMLVIAAQANASGRQLTVETETTGKKTKGRVLNAENEMPIDKVVVLALWKWLHTGLFGSTTDCLYAESTQTDINGYWQIPRKSYSRETFFPLPYGYYFYVDIFIYKPGYTLPHLPGSFDHAKGRIFESDSPRRYSVLLYNADKWVDVKDLQAAKKAVGYGNSYLIPTQRASIKHLEQMVNGSSCEAEIGSRKQILPFYQAIRVDVAAHAKAQDELDFLNRLDEEIEGLSALDVHK